MTCKRILVLASLLAAVLLVGCIKAKTVVNVQKDGSGTVEQTLYHKMPSFPMGGPMKEPSPEDQLQAARTQAQETAKKMGEGVAVQTVEHLPPRDGYKGMRIVYSFPDIGKIRVTPFPEMSAGGAQMGGPAGMAAAGGAAAEEKQEWIQFEFAKEPSPKLALIMPPMTPPENATPPAGDDGPQAQMAKAMMAQFLDGMEMELLVKVDGKIADSDATYVSSSRQVIGLLRMDLGSLVKDSAALDKMTAMEKAATPEEMQKQLQDPQIAKYVKVETKERVEITFE